MVAGSGERLDRTSSGAACWAARNCDHIAAALDLCHPVQGVTAAAPLHLQLLWRLCGICVRVCGQEAHGPFKKHMLPGVRTQVWQLPTQRSMPVVINARNACVWPTDDRQATTAASVQYNDNQPLSIKKQAVAKDCGLACACVASSGLKNCSWPPCIQGRWPSSGYGMLAARPASHQHQAV